MTQLKLIKKSLQEKPNLSKPYAKGSYNKINDLEQWIRISEGCPNACEYCRETFENGKEPIYYPIPKIVRNQVKILDMNLLYKSKALEILNNLGSKKVNNKVIYYEFICGIDYRYLTLELAQALKKNRFINIRFAWDYGFNQQKSIKKAITLLKKVGYAPSKIMVFILSNYKISFSDNIRKLELCKIWNVKVCECWFDNQKRGKVKPIYWSHKEIKEFGRSVRKHNQLVNFGIDPNIK